MRQVRGGVRLGRSTGTQEGSRTLGTQMSRRGEDKTQEDITTK